jgi:hypothetical protein
MMHCRPEYIYCCCCCCVCFSHKCCNDDRNVFIAAVVAVAVVFINDALSTGMYLFVLLLLCLF